MLNVVLSLIGLYVPLPWYVTVTVLSPSLRSTGTFTFPLLSVVPVTLFPFGSVMVIGAFGIGFPVIGSVSTVITLEFPIFSPSVVTFIVGIALGAGPLVTIFSKQTMDSLTNANTSSQVTQAFSSVPQDAWTGLITAISITTAVAIILFVIFGIAIIDINAIEGQEN